MGSIESWQSRIELPAKSTLAYETGRCPALPLSVSLDRLAAQVVAISKDAAGARPRTWAEAGLELALVVLD